MEMPTNNMLHETDKEKCSCSKTTKDSGDSTAVDIVSFYSFKKKYSGQEPGGYYSETTGALTPSRLRLGSTSPLSNVPAYLDNLASATIDARNLRLKPSENEMVQNVLGAYPISSIWTIYKNQDQETQFRREENRRNITLNKRISWIITVASALIVGMFSISQRMAFLVVWPYFVSILWSSCSQHIGDLTPGLNAGS
jgi:hypothetical protein